MRTNPTGNVKGQMDKIAKIDFSAIVSSYFGFQCCDTLPNSFFPQTRQVFLIDRVEKKSFSH